MRARFLVSPPTFHASPDARRQWARLMETMGCAGDVTFVELDADESVPDLMFTANAALVCGNLAVVSSFRHPERRREQRLYRAALARAGLATTYLEQTFFEGAGDALFDRVRPLLYAGYGWRSERNATLQLGDIVGCRVLPLLLVDERFYHVDTALCPLTSGHVMAYLDAFSPHAQSLLRRAIEPGFLIEIGLEDALALACNAVEVDDAIVLHRASRGLRERLYDAGYRVFSTELDELIAAGGSAKALTLRLDDGPALTAHAVSA
jgi:N-dimethylarginine dimethylaminohydrolase